MDIAIPQVGNNVANQLTKPSELPVNERVQKVELKDNTATQNASAKEEEKLLAAASENAKASSQQADTTNREVRVADFEQALSDISDFLQSTNRQLSFSVDEAADRSVVTVTDSESGDVIRQIPSEEVLKFAERINELQSEFGSSAGILLRGQA